MPYALYQIEYQVKPSTHVVGFFNKETLAPSSFTFLSCIAKESKGARTLFFLSLDGSIHQDGMPTYIVCKESSIVSVALTILAPAMDDGERGET